MLGVHEVEVAWITRDKEVVIVTEDFHTGADLEQNH